MPNRRPNKKPRADAESTRRRKMKQRREREEGGASAPAPDPNEPVRLNRYISQAGITSRRKADELIAAGKVSVDGVVVTEMGTKVDPSQRVEVDGQVIQQQVFDYVLLNKPKDTITTVDDDRDRGIVMDLLDDEARAHGVVPVGRLDRDTTGALLLTNDGDLTHRLMHPRYAVEKLYLVRASSPVKPHDLEQLRTGIELEDGLAKADRATYVGDDPREIGLALHEGRNRQIRRMMEALGYDVHRLDRVQYAGLTVDKVRRGQWRRLTPSEVNRLRRSVGLKKLTF
ncbi:MAG: pseudouridine synthase [Rhodothermales bacterium]